MNKDEEKCYTCEAIVKITGDQIEIDLNTDLGFADDTKIELTSSDNSKENGSSTVIVFIKAGHSIINGHAIIN